MARRRKRRTASGAKKNQGRRQAASMERDEKGRFVKKKTAPADSMSDEPMTTKDGITVNTMPKERRKTHYEAGKQMAGQKRKSPTLNMALADAAKNRKPVPKKKTELDLKLDDALSRIEKNSYSERNENRPRRRRRRRPANNTKWRT